MTLCKCGCGQEVGEGKEFVNGGHFARWKKSQEPMIEVSKEAPTEDIKSTQESKQKSSSIQAIQQNVKVIESRIEPKTEPVKNQSIHQNPNILKPKFKDYFNLDYWALKNNLYVHPDYLKASRMRQKIMKIIYVIVGVISTIFIYELINLVRHIW